MESRKESYRKKMGLMAAIIDKIKLLITKKLFPIGINDNLIIKVSKKLKLDVLLPETITLITNSNPAIVKKLSSTYEQEGAGILNILNRSKIKETLKKAGIDEIRTLEQAFYNQLAAYNECCRLLDILDKVPKGSTNIILFIEKKLRIKNTGAAISLIKQVGTQALEDLADNPGLIPALHQFHGVEDYEKAVRLFYSLCNVHSIKMKKQEKIAS